MEAKLTTAKIEKLAPGDKQYFVWDTRFKGLGLRISPGGSKAFIYQGRVGGAGTPKRITLGKFPVMSLQDAIDKASDVSKQLAAGIDPNRTKADNIAKNKAFARDQVRKQLTFGDLFTRYIDVHKSEWSKTYLNDHYAAARPYLTDKPYMPQPIGNIWEVSLAELTPDFVESWVRAENETRATTMAKNFRMFKACANWAEDTDKYAGLIPHKTYNSRKVNKSVQSVRAHKGALQKQQLKTWFNVVDQIDDVQRAALICMLMNGSRPGEMLQLKWSDIDFEWDTIKIIDKVDQWERVIPLTPYTKQTIKSLPRVNEFVFGNKVRQEGYIEITKKYRTLLIENGLPSLPPKAMRKSFRTLSEWVDVPRGIVNQVMGHRPSAIDEKHYVDRPIDLLRMWHGRIEQFILKEAGINTDHLYD